MAAGDELDVAKTAFAGFAFLLSLYTLYRQSSTEKRSAMKADAKDCIKDLRDQTRHVSGSIISHICWTPSRLSKEDIYGLQRRADMARTSLETFISCQKEDIFRQYTEWWSKVSSHFPADVKAHKVAPNSAEVKTVTDAQNALDQFLDDLRIQVNRNCLDIK